MDSKMKLNHENNNTSLPVQTQWRQKLIEEVNMKYRQFSRATKNIKEFPYEARILAVEKIEKIKEIDKFPRSIGLEQHLFEQTSDVDEPNHSQSESRCSLLHQNKKFYKISHNSSIFTGLNRMPVHKSNKTWNIVHIPTHEVLLCDECGVKFGSGRTLNRHKTHQHASYKLICPECDYATT